MITLLNTFWKTNKAMTAFLLASAVVLGISLAGLVFDHRQIGGAPAWAKTAKFTMSFLFYVPTMLWMFGKWQGRPRLRSFLLTSMALILSLEMVLVITQAVRGEATHFNVSTPFNAGLWYVMSATIALFYLISIVGFLFFLWQKLVDGPMALAMKLGMGIMLIGFGLGFLMTSPTPEQMIVLHTGAQPDMVGAHTVGAPDGGPGLPLLGWSTLHGDLRTAHFVGIHGAQAVPLVAWLLALLAARYRLTATHQRALIWGAAAGYLGLVAIVAWHALRGLSIIAPDGLTLATIAGLTVVIGAYGALVVTHARRRSHAALQAA